MMIWDFENEKIKFGKDSDRKIWSLVESISCAKEIRFTKFLRNRRRFLYIKLGMIENLFNYFSNVSHAIQFQRESYIFFFYREEFSSKWTQFFSYEPNCDHTKMWSASKIDGQPLIREFLFC